MASSSNSESQDIFDIFLSFRGPDTRTQFTDRLYHDLTREGYRVFRDREGIEKGENNKSELCKAIKNSSISIIVFSKTYTESTACLFEVQRIIKHRDAKPDHVILPLYYRVEPSDIKKQAEELAKATGQEVDFERKKVKIEEVKEWSASLMEVARMGGLVFGDNRYEAEFIAEIFAVLKRKQAGNTVDLAKNMKNLKRKVEYLSGQENDIRSQISSAEHQPWKSLKKEVEVWLADVQRFKQDVQKLEQEEAGELNFSSRMRLGKDILTKIQEVSELDKKGRDFGGLLIDNRTTSGLLLPLTKDYLMSAEGRNEEKIWECLMNDDDRMIGVYGMGGIGKTTIMKHIHNRLLREKYKFDYVHWVTVSKAFSITKLQSDIAKALNFSLLEDEDVTKRASQLYNGLLLWKKYILIFDDLWEEFKLEDVGIPEPTKSNGRKLVLTTRSIDVCRRMGCTPVKVELLTKQEALTLFLKKAAGHDMVLDPKLQEIPNQICEECAGLPLAIVTVAGSLQGVKETRVWRNALNELINSTKDAFDEVSRVLEQLKFSYSRLENKVLQDCFLYCSFYPEDQIIPVKQLIDYWIAEGFISEINSVEKEFDKGHHILRKLTDSCLLESSTGRDEPNYVQMHDLTRDMALSITRSSPRFVIKAGVGLKSIPSEVWSEDPVRVSLMYNKIIALPNKFPVCHQLTTLLLNANDFWMIPDSFFTNMPNLEVLDLSMTWITSLPKSISNLERLHAIILGDCYRLEDVPSLEKLKALKEFKLTNSKIKNLPEGIEELVNLIKLDLSGNRSLQMPPHRKLRRLSNLQYLKFAGTRAVVLAQDLLSMKQLEVVAVHFDELPELTRYMTSRRFQKLETYCLILGTCHLSTRLCSSDDRTVGISYEFVPVGTRVDQLELPRNVSFLGLHGFHDLNSLSAIPRLENLRKCEILCCENLESGFSASTFTENCGISSGTLEALHLGELPRFRVLFDGIASRHSIFIKLTRLDIFACHAVKNIFPVHLLQNIPNLEKLDVENCRNVENVIVETEEISDSGIHHDNSNTITLQKLQYLRLHSLPSLKSIYNGVMMCPSIIYVEIVHCHMVTRLPLSLHKDGDQATAPPALNEIFAQKGWWDSLEWDDPHTKTILQPYLIGKYHVVPDLKYG